MNSAAVGNTDVEAAESGSVTQAFDSFLDEDPKPYTENIPWGDVIHSAPNQSIRVYYQNIHGITSANKWDKWEHSVVSLHQRHVDVCCFSETNINWTENAKYKAAKILRDQYQYATLLTASCDDPSLSFVQQGGTCLGITGKVVGMIGKKELTPAASIDGVMYNLIANTNKN